MSPSKRSTFSISLACAYPHGRVRVADGPTIAGVQEGYVLGTGLDLTDTAQLILCLGSCDAVHNEPALHVVDYAEVLSSLLNLDNIHEPGREPGVGPHFAVDFDQTLLADGFNFFHAKGVLQTVPEEKRDRERLSLLVRTRAWLDGEHSSKFVKHP